MSVRDVQLQRVEDAGHHVWRLTDMGGFSMRAGLFVDADAAERLCRERGWRLVRPARAAVLVNTDPEGG